VQHLEQNMGEIKCTPLWFHNKCDGLLVKELVSILEVQETTFPKDMMVVNVDLLTRWLHRLHLLGF
jgi:hypothetical protein